MIQLTDLSKWQFCGDHWPGTASIEYLKQRIIRIFDSLKRDPFMIRRAVRDMVRRANMCFRERECHMEQLLENK